MAEACYIPQYLAASFKGVSFEAMDTESEHGRRGAEGEFPFGENTAYADMGRRIRTYSIKARFATNDHLAQADALVAVCESRGPGILIHPTRGAVRAACKSAKVTDNPITEQGVTYVQIQFVEANSFGAVGLSFGSLLGGIPISGILATAIELLTDNYHVDDLYYFRRNDVTQLTSDTLNASIDLFNEVSSTIADDTTYKALREMRNMANSNVVLSDASAVGQLMSDVLASIDAITYGEDKVDIFKRVANTVVATSRLTGDAAKAEDAVYGMVRLMSAAYMTRGAVESEPDTLDLAFTQYDLVASVLNQESESALANDYVSSHVKIREFLADVQQVLLHRAYELPAFVEYDFGSGVHSLVAAYSIYGDAKRFREIETRNHHQPVWNMGPKVVSVRV